MMLSWHRIIEVLKKHNLLVDSSSVDEFEFKSIAYDSRKVKSDGLFFIKGNFQPKFLEDAIKNGAKAYVAEKKYQNTDAFFIIVTDVQKAMAVLSAEFFNNPQDELFIVAYTGTKGKTTSVYFTHEILKNSTKNKTALFSTIDRILGPNEQFKSDLSTPESLDLFHDMRRVVDNGMTHLVMEVSSQAYKKSRVFNLKFDVGIFLNISPDHIGPLEHPTFEDYLAHKLMLLDNSKQVVVNNQSDHFDEIYTRAKLTHDEKDIFVYGRKNDELQNNVIPDVEFFGVENLNKSEISVNTLTKKAIDLNIAGKYTLNVPGDYNESNAASVLIASALANSDQKSMIKGLNEVTVPGRMESFNTKSHGIIYVDYAHNYISVKAILNFLHKQHPGGKVYVVLGSPGNKGESRREGFGQALTEEKANVVWLTADDPQYEDPKAIANEILQAIDTDVVDVKFEMDRETAIKNAISMSTKADVVAIVGKGLDPYQKINGVDTPYIGDMNAAKKVVLEIES